MPHSRPRRLCQPVLTLPELVIHASSWIDIQHWDCTMACEPYWKLYWSETRAARIHFPEQPPVEIEPGRLILIPPCISASGNFSIMFWGSCRRQPGIRVCRTPVSPWC